MFDYARRLKLAVGDTVRRSAMKAVAGLVIAVGAGFLIAALWSFLATDLDWGSTYASLTIGGAFVAIAAILWIASSRKRHKMPEPDDLRREVGARISLATGAATDLARSEARRVLDLAETKVHGLMDNATGRVNHFASTAERKVSSFVSGTAEATGLTRDNLDSAKETAGRATAKVREAANSDPGNMAKLIGAFAVGVTLAAKLHDARRDRRSDRYDDHY